MKTLLYISDVFEENHIFPSQVESLLPFYEQEFDVKSIFLTKSADKVGVFPNRLVLVKPKGAISPMIFDWFVFRKNVKAIKNLIRDSTPSIIVGRGTLGAMFAAKIKQQLCPNVKIITDTRGDVLDEHKDNRLKHFFHSQSSRLIYSKVDYVFCVSSYLKQLLATTYRFPESLISVFPTIVPKEKFYFDESVRAEYRKKLGYQEDQVVAVYSGSMNSYQNLEFILNEFDGNKNPKLKLLILTGDNEAVKQLVADMVDADRVQVLKVPYGDVSKYLQACDYGLMIRDPIPTNFAASPTKFGEYINSGLNVIYNKIDTDYHRMSVENDLLVTCMARKEDLSATFDRLEKPEQKNKQTVNSADIVAAKQVAILKSLIKE